MMMNRTSTLETLKAATSRAANGHAQEARRLKRWHLSLGIPAVSLSAVSATAAFVALQESSSAAARVAAAIVTVVVAVLATLQNFLRFAETAETHRMCGAAYRSIEREIQFFLDTYNASDSDLTAEQITTALASIRERLDELEGRAPEIMVVSPVEKLAKDKDKGFKNAA